MGTDLTYSCNGHHRLPVLVWDAEAPGQRELGHDSKWSVFLATGRVSIILLLETHGAATFPLIVLRRNTEVVTSALVGQAGIAAVLGPLPVHGHGSQVNLVVQKCLGIVTIGKLDHHNLLKDGVKIVKSSFHHSNCSWLVNFWTFFKNCPSVWSIRVYWFNLKVKLDQYLFFCISIV